MHKPSPTWMLLLAFGLAACPADDNDTDDTDDTDVGAASLTFDGGETYGPPHADQSYEMAVVECSSGALPCTGTVMETDAGTVPATGDFTVVFADVLQVGGDYELHLWIDSNFNDGTEGTCDEDVAMDHQWAFPVGDVSGDVTIEDEHDVTGEEYVVVCDSFA